MGLKLSRSGLDLIGVVAVAVAQQPVAVLEQVKQLAVALHLRQVLALVAQQALILLVAGGKVDAAPERCPALEVAEAHVREDEAGGGVGHAIFMTEYEPVVVPVQVACTLVPDSVSTLFAPAFNAVMVASEPSFTTMETL